MKLRQVSRTWSSSDRKWVDLAFTINVPNVFGLTLINIVWDWTESKHLDTTTGGSNSNIHLRFINSVVHCRFDISPFALFWKLQTEVGLAFTLFDTSRKWDVARVYLCFCLRYENHSIHAGSGALFRNRTQRGERHCCCQWLWLLSVVEHGRHDRSCCAGFAWTGPFPWGLLKLTP